MVYWIGPIYNGEGRPVYRKGTWVAWLPIGASTPVFKASGHTVQVLNLLIDEGLLPKYEIEQIAEIKELAKRSRLKLQNDVVPGKKTFKSRYLSAIKLR